MIRPVAPGERSSRNDDDVVLVPLATATTAAVIIIIIIIIIFVFVLGNIIFRRTSEWPCSTRQTSVLTSLD